MKNRELLYGIIFLILAQVMVGLNIVISKLLLETIPVFWLLEIRFSLAALTLLPLHWLTPARHQTLRQSFSHFSKKDGLSLSTQALCAGVFFNYLMLTGLNYTDANIAGIITSVLPAMIAILSWIFLKEKFSLQILGCIGFATLGLVIITLDKFSHLDASHSFFGDLIILISLLPEAAYYILSKLHPIKLPIFIASSLINALNALVLLPIALTTPWQPNLSGATLLILLAIGLTSGFFYTFWFMGAKRVDGIMASLSTASMPVATVVFAFVILSERITVLQLIGMSLVIFSIVIYARK